MTLKTWANRLGDIMSDGRVRGQAMLYFALALMK
jgi:hypothetical protein